MFDVTGTAQPIALSVQGTVEVDPRPNGRQCKECGPHGNAGWVDLSVWRRHVVPCLTCESIEHHMALGELGRMLTKARGARELDPEHPPTIDLRQLEPGRWAVRADVHRFLPEVSAAEDPKPCALCYGNTEPGARHEVRMNLTSQGLPSQVVGHIHQTCADTYVQSGRAILQPMPVACPTCGTILDPKDAPFAYHQALGCWIHMRCQVQTFGGGHTFSAGHTPIKVRVTVP